MTELLEGFVGEETGAEEVGVAGLGKLDFRKKELLGVFDGVEGSGLAESTE